MHKLITSVVIVVCSVVISGCFGSKQESIPATTSPKVSPPSEKRAAPSIIKETPKEQLTVKKEDDGTLTWSKLLKDRPKEMQVKQEALKTAMKSLKK